MNEELLAKAREIFSDDDYVESLVELETPEEVCASLKAKGLDITVDDINKLQETMQKYMDGELDDEALEQAAGGLCIRRVIRIVRRVVKKVVKRTVKNGVKDAVNGDEE